MSNKSKTQNRYLRMAIVYAYKTAWAMAALQKFASYVINKSCHQRIREGSAWREEKSFVL